MSYVDRLMAQTGIGPAAAAATHAEAVRPFLEAEAEVRQAAAPMQGEPSRDPGAPAPARPAPPAPPAAAQPAHGERAEPEAGIQRGAPASSVRADALPPPPAPGATAATPLVPEIVIRRRPDEVIAQPRHEECAQQPAPADVPGRPAAIVPRPQEQAQEAAPPQDRQPGMPPERATFLDIRDWVAITPALDETPAPAGMAAAAWSGDTAPGEAPAALPVAPAPQAVPERVPAFEENRVELSIGTVEVVVEAPAAPVEPVRPRQPVAAQVDAPSPFWSRLSRRYIRP